jgi:tRNA 2-thiouridine synthesizing protein E
MAVNTLDFDGRTIEVDAEGYLEDLADWTPEVAISLAAREGIVLTDAHRAILDLLRQFYSEFQLSPSTRPLVKYVALKLGPEVGNSAYLNRLFEGAPAKIGAKLAGLPKPTNCI